MSRQSCGHDGGENTDIKGAHIRMHPSARPVVTRVFVVNPRNARDAIGAHDALFL
jgi:hypothetical protein